MAQIPLMEGERGAYPFIVNRSEKFISEERNGISFTRIPGRFSVCDSVNGNNRRYPKKVWEKNLNDGSLLKLAIAKNGAFGLLEHPADGRISLQSPICILVTDAKLQQGQDEGTKQRVDEVVGEIIVLNTAEGQKLRALIEVGYNPLVSSRGFGSVVKASDGVDEVQEDYVCEGWDVVLKPSFERAELFVNREGKNESKTPSFAPAEPPKPLAEALGVNMWRVFQSLAEKEHKKSFNSLTDSEANAIVAKAAAMTQEERVALAILTPKQFFESGFGEFAAPVQQQGQATAPGGLGASPSAGVPPQGHTDYAHPKISPEALEKAHEGYMYHATRSGDSPEEAERMWQAFVKNIPPETAMDIQRMWGESQNNLPKTESSSAAAAAPVAASAKTPMTENKSMDINEIKSRIGAVKGTPVPKEPARFAEGLNEMAAIHQEIANFVAEDAKRGWQGQKLHEEVSRIEKAWSETVLAPGKAAVKLNENYSKVLKVTKILGEAAIGIRKKLSEALAQNAEAAQLIEELTERGQAWVAIADKRKEQVADLNHKLEVSCEALDIIKTRYHEDMTEMGRHVITLEFAEKAQTPEIQKLLKEAKTPKDIIAIREKLDPEGAKKAQEAAAAKTEGKDCDKCKKNPCCCEKQEGKTAPAAAAPVNEGKNASAPAAEMEPRVLVPSVRSISESVAMVQRLSGTTPEKPKEEPVKK